MMQSSDQQLMAELFRSHGERIYAFCVRLCGNTADAEDLASEVFLDAPQAIARFRQEASQDTLLYRIAVNKWRSKRRSAARLVRRLSASVKGEAQESHEDAVLTDVAFAEALQKLNPRFREAFLLVKAEGLRYEEVATILAVPVGTVKSRVHEAAKQLANHLAPALGPFVEVTNEV